MIVRTTILILVGLLFANVSLGDVGNQSNEEARFAALRESQSAFSGALAAHRRGDLTSAKRRYETAIEGDASFVEAMVNLARVHIDSREYSEAAEWLDRAEAAHPEYPDLEVVRGLLALRAERIAAAIDLLSRARASQPRNVEVMTNLAAGFLAQGRQFESIALLVEANQLDPNRAATIFNLGLAYDRSGDIPRAVHYYERFIELVSHQMPERRAVETRLVEIEMALNGLEAAEPVAASRDTNTNSGSTSLADGLKEETEE